MNAVIVQPPFVQLNAPYPAAWYLERYLKDRGVAAMAFDHSIELYRELFSAHGLHRIFGAAEQVLGEGKSAAGHPLDDASREQLLRYLSYRDAYLAWTGPLLSFLSGGDPGLAHRLGCAQDLPRGARTQAFLEARGGIAGHDGAPELATRILEDLGDLVVYAYDPQFGTVRYAERLASSKADFSAVRRALDDSAFVRDIYEPYLRDFWNTRAASAGTAPPDDADTPRPIDLVLITIPFPGSLVGALACARAARGILGPETAIIFGGGYITTELRALKDPGIFDFCEYLAFDAGYGALASIMDRIESGDPASPLYRVMTREGARVASHGFEGNGVEGNGVEARPAATTSTTADPVRDYARAERDAVRSTFPDYRSVDFSRYLRVVDSANPMHRLWSDTPWLKYHLARGCYWKKCAFCDTELEYVAGYAPSRIAPLMDAAESASEASGLYGIHFVDEAMPMASLLAFADANIERARAGKAPFHFWGNMRFDATWTADRCEFLASAGLVAVSGGIEIATERGLAMTDKGFDLAGLVRTLVSLKRAGILVHAYLIYGFPGQSAREIRESAEVCRQLFAAGLVDSAFWHRFTLTRHSRMYAEWRAGKRPSLRPHDAPRDFADNDLSFEGEHAFDRFDDELASSMSEWMEGEGLDRRASRDVDAGLVESLIAKAEAAQDAAPELALDADTFPARGTPRWTGGAPRVVAAGADRASLVWAYRGELERIEGMSRREAETIARAIAALGEREIPALGNHARILIGRGLVLI